MMMLKALFVYQENIDYVFIWIVSGVKPWSREAYTIFTYFANEWRKQYILIWYHKC